MQKLVRFLGVLVLAIFVSYGISTRPAHAGWGATLSDGCGTNCASPGAVCDYWGVFYGGGCLGITGPAYDSYGRLVGWDYNVLHGCCQVIPSVALPFCTSPQVKDALSPSGCSNVAPPPLKQLGPCKCRTGSKGSDAAIGDPINITNGNLYDAFTDFETAGANKLAFIRYYNSGFRGTSSLGWVWRSNFDVAINVLNSSSLVVVVMGNGASYSFTASGGVWSTDTDVDGKLTTDGSTEWTYVDQDDNVYTFDYTTGKLQTITNRVGYEQTMAYDTNGNLQTVTDTYGRTLSFTFVNGSISTMTDTNGKVYTYTYDGPIVSNPTRLLQVTFPGSGSPNVQYKYENTDYPFALTGIVDENGHRYATFGYDANERANLSEHAGGADEVTVSYSLDAYGDGTATMTNAFGKTFVYTVSGVTGVGKVTQIVSSATAHTVATTVTLSYDTNGYLASRTDENGNVTNYTNDSRGLVTSEVDAYGSPVTRTISTTWDTTYHVPTEIVQPNLTTDYTYSSGLLTQLTLTDTTTQTVPYSTNGQTRVWAFTYTTGGLLHTVDGPLSGSGDTTTYTYDTSGFVSSVTDQVGHVTTISSVNGRGEPLTSVDPNSISTNYTYDDRGRILSFTVNPGANQALTTLTYDAAGNITEIVAPDGSTLTYGYDNAHRLTSVTNNLGETITYTLDAMGGRTATVVKSASSVITKQQTATFDELGRILAEIGAASQTTTHVYDANGNEISTTDPRSKVYGHAFDALNRLYQETDPDSFHTVVAYNGKDEVTSVTDARSNATTYVRDGFGDAIRQTSPDTGITDFWYDANGNVTKKVDARSVETDFTYDNAGRVLTKAFPAASAEDVTYAYDATSGGNDGVGRLTSITDQSGSTAFTYNPLGQVTLDSRVIGSNTYGVTYTYDPAGNVLTETYPSGRIVTYTRDTLGRVSGVTTKQSSGASVVTVASSVTYEPYGPLAGLTYGNSVVLVRTFDQDYQLTAINAAVGATTVQDLTNGYDAASNITSITDSLSPTRSQTVTYDDLNRIATAAGAYGAQTYTYDGVGNRLTRTIGGGASETYAYPVTSNRLSTVTDGGNVRTFTYLATGQVSQDVRDPSDTFTYAANDNGRNTSASLNGSAVGSYVYNALEQRTQKTGGGATTQFVFDSAGHLIAEVNASGVTQKEYIWLDDMPAAMVDDTGASPVIYYIHPDQIGTPQKITDGSANVVWDGVFDPFGNAVANSGSNWGTPNWGSFNWAVVALSLTNLRFPGQYADAETGLNQNWFRDYDDTLGRYTETDPSRLFAGTDLYSYALNTPFTAFDPFGLWQITLSGGGEVGGAITLGYNSGQWNFGGWFGAGAGLNLKISPEDTPCERHGFQPSIRGQASGNLGPFGITGGGVLPLGYGAPPPTLSVSVRALYGLSYQASENADGVKRIEGPSWSTSLAAGASAFLGIGGVWRSHSCGCQSGQTGGQP